MRDTETYGLTTEDLDLIEDQGVPVVFRSDLAIRTDNDGLILTRKGVNFFKEVCRRYGMGDRFRYLTTQRSLMDLSIEVSERKLREAEAALAVSLERGEVPGHEQAYVRALLYGTPDQVIEALTAQRECATHGKNVIAFPRV